MWKVVASYSTDDLGLPSPWKFAQLPTPIALAQDMIRVFFASRMNSRPHVWACDFRLDSLLTGRGPVAPAVGPLWSPGPPGSWNQDGIYPSTVAFTPHGPILYGIGWERGSQDPLFRSSIGVREFCTLHSPSEGPIAPIMDRSAEDPFLVTSPTIRRTGDWYHMIYVSGDRWITVGNRLDSRYSLRQAWSLDGLRWERRGTPALMLTKDVTHIGRTAFVGDAPNRLITCVTTEQRKEYRLVYAVPTGAEVAWALEEPVKFSGDRAIHAYPALLQVRDTLILLGNQSDRGASGFQVAVVEGETQST